MSQDLGATYRAVPLGGLGTGTLEFCDDGRLRNLEINNNRSAGGAIPVVPHTFLAVRAASDDDIYLRRLQTPTNAGKSIYLLPSGGLQFRGNYPQVDYKVVDENSPLAITFGAYAPVVPYDYEASSSPLIFIALQLINTSPVPQQVSALLNWQNTVGQRGTETPEYFSPIASEILVTEDDWERAKKNDEDDNERRLHTESGRVSHGEDQVYYEGDIPPNALIFGDGVAIDANEDGQYCVVARWEPDTAISTTIWDPESPEEGDAFWAQFEASGAFTQGRETGAIPRSGAVANQFLLNPGERRTIEFVVSWYGPRHVIDDVDGGNFYTNSYIDGRAVARMGLQNGKYYHASVTAWRARIGTAGYPKDLVNRILAVSDILSTHTLHGRNGSFGLLQSPSDPRINCVRDRWYWSMALLLFYPRLESEMLGRLCAAAIAEDGKGFIVSEGLAHVGAPEYVGHGATQVEAAATLVMCAYRNYLFTGNISAIAQRVPHIERVMAYLLTQDKNFDGFPDIQSESPGLDGDFALGFNVITAGMWLVALHVCETMAASRRMKATPLFTQARERAALNFDRNFWDEEGGYYTLYPAASPEVMAHHPLSNACHVGQLSPVWMADVLGLEGVFPEARVARATKTIGAHNISAAGMLMISWPKGVPADLANESPGTNHNYGVVPYVCVRLHRESFQSAYLELDPLIRRSLTSGHQSNPESRNHVGGLALWYVLVASPVVQIRLAEKRLELRPDRRHAEDGCEHTLITSRGFGRVHLQCSHATSFSCSIRFSMDIPLELTSIRLFLESDPGPVTCIFELAEGTVPLRIETTPGGNGGVILEIFPAIKTPASSFDMHLEPKKTEGVKTSNRKKWLPRWIQRGGAG